MKVHCQGPNGAQQWLSLKRRGCSSIDWLVWKSDNTLGWNARFWHQPKGSSNDRLERKQFPLLLWRSLNGSCCKADSPISKSHGGTADLLQYGVPLRNRATMLQQPSVGCRGQTQAAFMAATIPLKAEGHLPPPIPEGTGDCHGPCGEGINPSAPCLKCPTTIGICCPSFWIHFDGELFCKMALVQS